LWAAENPDSNFPTQLSVDTPLSAEGYFVLSWDNAQSVSSAINLLQSNTPAFVESRTRDIPANGSVTITGLADGDYYFRLQDGVSLLSNTVQVRVAHHSLGRAFAFFSVGALVFGILIISIVTGRKQQAV